MNNTTTQFNAFDCLAGSNLGTWSESEVIEELIDVLNFQCGPEAHDMALDMIKGIDLELTEAGTSTLDDMEPEYLQDVYQDLIDALNHYANTPSSTYIECHDSEVIVMPYIDDDVSKYSEHPEKPGDDHQGECAGYEYYFVNDHGNVDYMVWQANTFNSKPSEYVNVWSMV